jgi:hypothetical protein
VVEGYYECPVPFTVDVAALAVEYTAVVAGEPLILRLPSAVEVNRSHVELSAPTWSYSEREDLLSNRPELAPFWGNIVVWAQDFEAPKAANVRRIGISLTVDGDDDSLRDAGRKVASAMRRWWAAVSAWIEVLHGQDLSRLGPIEPGIKFSGTTLWAQLHTLHDHPLDEGSILPVGSSAFEVVWPNYIAIDAPQLQGCIDYAQRHEFPPVEWLLIRDANSLCAGRDFRRSVLDAGLAVELAVTGLIRNHLTTGGHPNIDRELHNNRTLGGLCTYWTGPCGGTLPAGYQARLIDRRNDATHAGADFSEADVRDTITVARELVNQAMPLPR